MSVNENARFGDEIMKTERLMFYLFIYFSFVIHAF